MKFDIFMTIVHSFLITVSYRISNVCFSLSITSPITAHGSDDSFSSLRISSASSAETAARSPPEVCGSNTRSFQPELRSTYIACFCCKFSVTICATGYQSHRCIFFHIRKKSEAPVNLLQASCRCQLPFLFHDRQDRIR